MAAHTRDTEKWLGSGYILKVEPTGFVDGLVVWCGARQESKIMPRFGA